MCVDNPPPKVAGRRAAGARKPARLEPTGDEGDGEDDEDEEEEEEEEEDEEDDDDDDDDDDDRVVTSGGGDGEGMNRSIASLLSSFPTPLPPFHPSFEMISSNLLFRFGAETTPPPPPPPPPSP